ncbi:MAG TPA: adenylosuccinate synthase [Vicinamibacteria bacterium]|nr:adenylosuccinate synthase [Vicinamibacteria bacterium]
MPSLVVVGTQWGDEGKGKYVDLLSRQMQVVVRYGGGHNAGHTVVVGKDEFILHIIPSGILHPGVACVIGNGCVVDPEAFLAELEKLGKQGIAVGENLLLSDRAQLILPYHRLQEQREEEKLGSRRIGTTLRGIGPAYEDKIGRRGLRVGDLRHPDFLKQKLDYLVREKTEVLGIPEQAAALRASIGETLSRFREVALPHVADTSLFVYRALEAGKDVLFEGAQATLLDIDHGTYPFVTSSHPTAGGAATGSGVSPKALDFILGITKAYITRVGAGPFPTEMDESLGNTIREKGAEYGASTGRPRRCGWFDSVVVRYAKRINGLDALAITKLDVLDCLDEIRICTHYEYKGERIDEFPGELSMLEECKPVYETLPGWKKSTEGTNRLKDLPQDARKYLARLETLCGTPVAMISTGRDRNATILDMEKGSATGLERWVRT